MRDKVREWLRSLGAPAALFPTPKPFTLPEYVKPAMRAALRDVPAAAVDAQ